MKRKGISRRFWTLLIIAIMTVFVESTLSTQSVGAAKVEYTQSSVPTLFFHGGGSNYHAEEHMVNAARRAGATNTIIRAFVSGSGKVRLDGKISKHAINPIVEVNYSGNRKFDLNGYGQWAKNVVVALQKKDHITKFNMVGHSAGNMSILYYMLEFGNDKTLPKLQKQVDIAGPFSGIRGHRMPKDLREPTGLKLNGAGKPNKMNATYRQMTALRHTFPKHQVDVLNLYGDIGDHTDGTVPNVSSLSLRYLIANRAKSYREHKFTGPRAKHSSLHNNPRVDRVLIKFLWAKN